MTSSVLVPEYTKFFFGKNDKHEIFIIRSTSIEYKEENPKLERYLIF